jgi:hypothetical protein
MLESLSAGFDVRGFWFNPNIHPGDERASRLEAVRKLDENKKVPLAVAEDECTQQEWIDSLNPESRQKPGRCRYCYTSRLKRTAEEASKKGIAFFSTTLLASPYQEHNVIISIGREIASSAGIEFVERDIRPVFYEGKNEAYRMGLYMQKYCGCIFSRDERK